MTEDRIRSACNLLSNKGIGHVFQKNSKSRLALTGYGTSYVRDNPKHADILTILDCETAVLRTNLNDSRTAFRNPSDGKKDIGDLNRGLGTRMPQADILSACGRLVDLNMGEFAHLSRDSSNQPSQSSDPRFFTLTATGRSYIRNNFLKSQEDIAADERAFADLQRRIIEAVHQGKDTLHTSHEKEMAAIFRHLESMKPFPSAKIPYDEANKHIQNIPYVNRLMDTISVQHGIASNNRYNFFEGINQMCIRENDRKRNRSAGIQYRSLHGHPA